MSASKQAINQSCPPGVESAESQHPCHSDLT